MCVFMSSHILAEVAHLADRIGIVHEGRLLEELDRDQLSARERSHVEVAASDPGRAAALLGAAGVDRVERVGDRLRVWDADGRGAEIARVLVGGGVGVDELTPVREDLEAYVCGSPGGSSDVRAGPCDRVPRVAPLHGDLVLARGPLDRAPRYRLDDVDRAGARTRREVRAGRHESEPRRTRSDMARPRLGASHQTGWTGLAAPFIRLSATFTEETILDLMTSSALAHGLTELGETP